MVVVWSGLAHADGPRRPVLLFDASPAETAERGAQVSARIEEVLAESRHVRLVRREGSGVYLPSDGRVDPAAPARAREQIVVAREAMARVALDEAERALYDAIATFGAPATPEVFEEYWGTQLELASVLLEAQKQQSALQLFARAVVLAPNHEMDPERFSPFVRDGFADARRTAALLPRGSLVVESEPAGAEVIVDGEVRGVAPAEIEGLFSGEHVVALRMAGRAPFARLVPVGAGESRVTVLLAPAPDGPAAEEEPEILAGRLARSLEAEVALVVAATTGSVRVRVVPATEGPSAEAWREMPGDESVWAAELDGMLRRPVVRPRIDWRVRVRPPPPPAWYERWYFWTTLGAAVAGGVILTFVALGSEEPGDPTVPFPDGIN